MLVEAPKQLHSVSRSRETSIDTRDERSATQILNDSLSTPRSTSSPRVLKTPKTPKDQTRSPRFVKMGDRYKDKTSTDILTDAISSPAQTRLPHTLPVSTQEEEDEEEESSLESSSVMPGQREVQRTQADVPPAKMPVMERIYKPATTPSIGSYEEEEEEEWLPEEEEESSDSATRMLKSPTAPAPSGNTSLQTNTSGSGTKDTSAVVATTTKDAEEEESHTSDLMTTEDSDVVPQGIPKHMTPKGNSSLMYRTLTGKLDDIIAKSTIHSMGVSEEDEEEFEFFSETNSQIEVPPSVHQTSTPVARPNKVQFTESPDASPAGSARQHHQDRSVTAEEEEEWEDEEEEYYEEEEE